MKYTFFLLIFGGLLILGCNNEKQRSSGHNHNEKSHQHNHEGHSHTKEGAHHDNPHTGDKNHSGSAHNHRQETGHAAHGDKKPAPQVLHYPEEKHLKNIRQLTFGGDNAEAYWSFDDKHLVFQARNEAWGSECDQIYLLDPFSDKISPSFEPKLLSTGLGRTTCSYFMPGDKSVIYASTHLGGDACPPEPPRGDKYVWPIYESFDIFTADLNGKLITQLTDEPGYCLSYTSPSPRDQRGSRMPSSA